METIYFVLGALSVVATASLVSVFRIKKEVRNQILSESNLIRKEMGETNLKMLQESNLENQKSLEDLGSSVYSELGDIHVDLGNMRSDISKEVDTINRDLEDVRKYVDSRVDKSVDFLLKDIREIYSKIDSK